MCQNIYVQVKGYHSALGGWLSPSRLEEGPGVRTRLSFFLGSAFT